MNKGTVYLVGAGPGDEGLITVKGLRSIQEADVILYDRLLNLKLLESAPSHCELIYCGKLPKKHTLKQEIINDILVQKALEGHSVVRLKGGDPGVFGRVGEEAEFLARHQIPFEIIPGITSGIAAPLYAGIPVTNREYGGSFAIVTAHDQSEDGKPSIKWTGLANSVDTIAFYMGIANLSYISENLIRCGKPAETPVILIQWGTYGRQKTLQGTLADIAKLAEETNFQNPAITLVGDIVSLKDKLTWFEKKPLYGRQILFIRTGIGKSSVAKSLKEQGADVIEFPKWVKREVPVNENILNNVSSYDRILFTSPESIHDFFDLLADRKTDIRAVRASLFCLSNQSLKVLNNRGLAGFLSEEMGNHGKLLIIGERKRHDQKFYLARYGQHDPFQTSEKCIDEKFIPVMKQMLSEADIDSVIFPSSYSVDVFMEYAVSYGLNAKDLLTSTQIRCMGESSWHKVKDYGFQPHNLQAEPVFSQLSSSLIKEKDLERSVV